MQLVINTFGASLRKEGERFVVRAGDKHLAVSAHKVRSILLTTAFHLSTDAIPTANQATIRIALPVGNVFSVEAVQTLMKALSEGGRP